MNEPTPDPSLKPVEPLALPEDSILLPYRKQTEGVYEHGFAAFAHDLAGTERTGPASAEMILHYSTRTKKGYTLLILRWPLIAWNLDTNRSNVCKALILVDKNSSGRMDVWSSDSIAMAQNMFDTCAEKKK